jgi:hypothetical protein
MAYTATVIDARDFVTHEDELLSFHDILVGGKLAPREDVPAWAMLEVHGLIGDSQYSDGGAVFLGGGLLVKDLTLEAGAGMVLIEQDEGITVSARAAYRLNPWLEVAALGIFTKNNPTERFLGNGAPRWGYGAEVKLGPFFGDLVRAELRWLGGERVLALDRMGTVVENLPEIFENSFSALVSFRVHEHVSVYGGGGIRWAEFPNREEYRLATAFVGCELSF